MSVSDTTAPYGSRNVDDFSTSLGSGLNGLAAARAERLVDGVQRLWQG
jgi:hypothetical protein